MAQTNDFLLSEDGDFVTKNGDFLFGPSTDDEVLDIIMDNTGHWRNSPLLGVGLNTYLNASGKETELERLIGLHLESDGLKVDYLKVEDGFKIHVKARRI